MENVTSNRNTLFTGVIWNQIIYHQESTTYRVTVMPQIKQNILMDVGHPVFGLVKISLHIFCLAWKHNTPSGRTFYPLIPFTFEIKTSYLHTYKETFFSPKMEVLNAPKTRLKVVQNR